jgi:hypothetical protein
MECEDVEGFNSTHDSAWSRAATDAANNVPIAENVEFLS